MQLFKVIGTRNKYAYIVKHKGEKFDENDIMMAHFITDFGIMSLLSFDAFLNQHAD